MARVDVFRVRSDKDTHFTTLLVTNAFEQEDIATGAGAKKFAILAVELLADQNLDWELWFWNKSTAEDTDLDLDAYIGRVAIAVADHKQYGASGTYYVNKELAAPIVYIDDDAPGTEPKLHVSLLNRSATSKNAGATGEVVLIVTCEPIG
jgi:hypothetical protein